MEVSTSSCRMIVQACLLMFGLHGIPSLEQNVNITMSRELSCELSNSKNRTPVRVDVEQLTHDTLSLMCQRVFATVD